MGIDIGCCLIVGVPGDDLNNEDILGEKDLYDYIRDNNLDYSSPWYDAGYSKGVVGFMVNCTDNFSLVHLESLKVSIENAREHFKGLTGLEPSLYLSNNVT